MVVLFGLLRADDEVGWVGVAGRAKEVLRWAGGLLVALLARATPQSYPKASRSGRGYLLRDAGRGRERLVLSTIGVLGALRSKSWLI